MTEKAETTSLCLSITVAGSREPESCLIFEAFLRYGGMPGLADVGLNQENAMTLLDGVYTTVLVRDILQRDQMTNQRKITDQQLLQRITRYLAGNIGNLCSYTNMSKELFKAELLPENAETNPRSSSPSVHTVQDYVDALMKAYMFQEVKRFDIKGNALLKTQGKFYIANDKLSRFFIPHCGLRPEGADQDYLSANRRRRSSLRQPLITVAVSDRMDMVFLPVLYCKRGQNAVN